jgi:hypothetical protein
MNDLLTYLMENCCAGADCAAAAPTDQERKCA